MAQGGWINEMKAENKLLKEKVKELESTEDGELKALLNNYEDTIAIMQETISDLEEKLSKIPDKVPSKELDINKLRACNIKVFKRDFDFNAYKLIKKLYEEE